MTQNENVNRLGVDQDIRGMWAGSALQTNFPLPKWQMGSSSGGGSVTFTDRQIQLREPGAASAAEQSRAFDDITEFDPSVPGSVTIHISNITIDNSADAEIELSITDTPDGGRLSGSDRLTALIEGNGGVFASTSDDGSGSSTSDTSQDNAYISALNTIKAAWDGSTLTVTTDDGSTAVTVTHSSNYPAGESLFLKIAATDQNSSAAQNADFDVDAIEVGT